MSKAADKIRNLSLAELKTQERDQMDQLFRLKFQLKMGQSESLNKIRSLRRNVARIKTFLRQHQLGISMPVKAEAVAEAPAKKVAAKKTAAKKAEKE
ncbi:MAG: 50S ribosomal protein L29 [Acidobacteriales bacterium]|nr:50S ribosomal protein L29 [Terriglobales bacterium]